MLFNHFFSICVVHRGYSRNTLKMAPLLAFAVFLHCTATAVLQASGVTTFHHGFFSIATALVELFAAVLLTLVCSSLATTVTAGWCYIWARQASQRYLCAQQTGRMRTIV